MSSKFLLPGDFTMAQGAFEPVYWLITDLAKYERRHPMSRITSRRSFASLKHWAIQVGDRCYEVTSYPAHTEMKLYELSAADWERKCQDKKVGYNKYQIGVTSWSDDAISLRANHIWDERFQKKYKLPVSNCQNFASLLFKAIALDPKTIDKATKRQWKEMPNPITDTIVVSKVHLLAALLHTHIFHALILAFLGSSLTGLCTGIVGTTLISYYCLKRTPDKKYLRKIQKGAQSLLGKTKIAPEPAALTHEEQQTILKDLEEIEEANLEGDGGYVHDQKAPYADADTSATKTIMGRNDISLYQGYNQDMIDNFAAMGFPVEHVVAGMRQWGIDPCAGQFFHFHAADQEAMVRTLLQQC